MPKKRLSKALAAAGIASRRHAEELIAEGRVTVNGSKATLPQTLIDWSSDRISFDGKVVSGEEKKLYYMLNKPKGFICSHHRIGRKKLVIDLFQAFEQRLFTIGRLDRDTTGLLLISNDGHFAQRVIHPSANLSKEYILKTKQEISHEHLVALAKGARIEGQWIRPKKVHKVRKGTLKIVVKEGKKREVRCLAQQAGLIVLSLKRVRIGGLLLGPLKEGRWREMTEEDRAQIFR